MKYIYLPEAFLPALQAAGIALHGNESAKKLTSVEALSGILSPQDVAFYWYLNIHTQAALPAPITSSMQSALHEVLDPKGMGESTNERTRAVADIMQGYVLNDNAPYLPTEDKVLDVLSLDEDTLIFTHRDGPAETERDMYDRVIRTMSAFMPFEEVAAMPVFGGYLRAAQIDLKSATA